MWTWSLQTKLAEEWSHMSIGTWNIRCIDALMRVPLRCFPIENWTKIFDTWQSTLKSEGFAFGVGRWLSALCKDLNNLSASFCCVYFFDIVRHHIIVSLFNTKRPIQSRVFFWKVLPKSLESLREVLKPFCTWKCMCTRPTWVKS
jgi:hypothetical protein